MNSMIWKELRENAKWAALALLGLGIAEIYALSTQGKDFRAGYTGLTLCSTSFLTVTAFGCALIGAALGGVQILPELRRDQWAALLHRPVSRSVIFFGKVVAGLLLYLAATLIPFFTSVLYATTPGQFPVPFVPGLMLAGLSDVVMGLVFYFGALLLCLDRGRWFGTRGAIALALIAILLLHTGAMGTTNLAFLLPLFSALVLLLAAWGAMLANGPVGHRPRVGRLAFVLVVFVGVQSALFALFTGVQMIPWNNDTPSAVYTEFQVSQDGQVFLQTQKGDGSEQHLTDMTGKPVTDERYIGNRSSDAFCQFIPLGFDIRHQFKGYFLTQGQTRNSASYLQPIRDSFDSKEAWYLLIGENYFIGYDSLSRRCIGICDREGFKPAGATPKPFPEALRGSVFSYLKPTLFISGTQIYSFDFSERTMTPFYNPEKDTVYEATTFGTTYNSDKPGHVMAALQNDLRLFDDQGTVLLTIPYLHDPNRWDYISIGWNAAFDRIYLQSEASFWSKAAMGAWGKASDTPTCLDELDLQGHVLRTYSHPGLPDIPHADTWIESIVKYSMPLGVTAPSILVPSLFSLEEDNFESDSPNREPLSTVLLYLGALFLAAVILAAIAFRWARRMGFPVPRARAWAIFVFLFGPAGLLTFRLASDCPVRVACPLCGRKRSIEEETCSDCGKPWPSPEPNGTEIMETLPVGGEPVASN